MNSSEHHQRCVEVGLTGRSYPIIISDDALNTLGQRIQEVARGSHVMVITDENVGPLYADQALASLSDAGFQADLQTVPAGDSTKCLDIARQLWDAMADAKIDRTSPVIALGGGVIGDLTGFVASTWMRGVPFVQCPTTIEADVDASVGGKTAINHPSGKNMIGAFYQPKFVLIDTSTLSTLSDRDFRAGLAESVKHAVIRDASFFDWHVEHVDTVLSYQPEALGALIERNVRIKADIVAQDERETTGIRALLNFGHTIGHAIESTMAKQGEPWRHGEAVAAGMVAACEMSVVADLMTRSDADRVTSLLERMGLPVSAPLADQRASILGLMQLDKKVAQGKVRFVLADGIGSARLHDQVPAEWIEAGLQKVLT